MIHLRSVGRRSCFSDSWSLLANEIIFLQKILVHNNKDVQHGAIFNHVLKIYLYQIQNHKCKIENTRSTCVGSWSPFIFPFSYSRRISFVYLKVELLDMIQIASGCAGQVQHFITERCNFYNYFQRISIS
jgi:hypothetical protein